MLLPGGRVAVAGSRSTDRWAGCHPAPSVARPRPGHRGMGKGCVGYWGLGPDDALEIGFRASFFRLQEVWRSCVGAARRPRRRRA